MAQIIVFLVIGLPLGQALWFFLENQVGLVRDSGVLRVALAVTWAIAWLFLMPFLLSVFSRSQAAPPGVLWFVVAGVVAVATQALLAIYLNWLSRRVDLV